MKLPIQATEKGYISVICRQVMDGLLMFKTSLRDDQKRFQHWKLPPGQCCCPPVATAAIQECGFEPSDFYRLPKMKRELGGCYFDTITAVSFFLELKSSPHL